MGADFFMALDSIKNRLGARAVAIQIPIGSEENFRGMVDLINLRTILYTDELGTTSESGEVPEELRELVARHRHDLVEAAADFDDRIMEKYLEDEGQTVTHDELVAALRRGTVGGYLVPVLCGAALRNRGVQPMLDAVVDFLPSPADVKAVEGTNPKDGRIVVREPDEAQPILLENIQFPEPVMSVAIEPKTNVDLDKMGIALQRLSEEDPTFRVHTDEETGQNIIAGMGELHLEIIVDRMIREFNVDANVGKPQVAYKEAIRRPAKGIGHVVRHTGGKGQCAHVELEIDPGARGAGYVSEDNIRQGSIPREYIPAVQKGIAEAITTGVVAGYPVLDIKVKLVDGQFHPVDSSEMAFGIAG